MPDHADWPLGVQEISIENLASLGVNDEGEIFWNGKRIEVRRRLLLTLVAEDGGGDRGDLRHPWRGRWVRPRRWRGVRPLLRRRPLRSVVSPDQAVVRSFSALGLPSGL